MDISEAVWRKSQASTSEGQCVMVATNLPGHILVKDSKNPQGPVLDFTPTEWSAFLTGATNGEFSI